MGVAYTDASCTQPIGMTQNSPTCGAPIQSYIAITAQCSNSVTRLFHAAQRIETPPVYFSSGTSCAGPYTYGPETQYFALGVEVLPTDVAQLS